MRRISRALCLRWVCTVVGAIFVYTATASTGAAQFRLPKIPKTPKVSKKEAKPSEPATPEIKPSKGATIEVLSAISPDAAPPGGYGKVVVTGDFFKDGMSFEFRCEGAEFKPDSIKVESPKRLVAQIHVPVNAQEGPCGTSLRSMPGKEPFRISMSAGMPVSVPAILLGEGDMQFFELMMKMQQAMAPGFGSQGAQGHIEIAAGSIKYVKGGQMTFTESVSGVKDVGEMTQGGTSIGIFRIVFNDGKIYNLAGGTERQDAHQVFEFLEKRLGK
jgi:hypothetical protein